MARTARVKENAAGTAHYHLMSRADDKRFLFEKGRAKDSLVDALKRAAEFSGMALCFAVPKGSGRSQVSENYVSAHQGGLFKITNCDLKRGTVMFFFDLIKRRDEATQGQQKLHCQKRSCSTL